MKNKKRGKFFAILLSCMLIISMMPNIGLTAFALETTYNIWVAGTQITASNATDVLGGGTVTYNAATNTLTLNDANITYDINAASSSSPPSGAIHTTGALNIELIGTNTVTNTSSHISGNANGIYAFGDLTISGAGSLEVTCTGKIDKISNGIYLWQGNLNISNSGYLTAVGGDSTDSDSNGINLEKGDLTIGGSGNLTATGGVVGGRVTYARGMLANNIAINRNGTVTATGQGAKYGTGIYTKHLTIDTNGTVIATGNANGIQTYGSTGTAIVTIENGTVQATGKYGIYSGSIQIYGGSGTATGSASAMNVQPVDRSGQPVATSGAWNSSSASWPKTTVYYDLWVAGKQVDSDNAADVLGEADGQAKTVTYDADSGTLTLNGATVTHDGSGPSGSFYKQGAIFAKVPLNIVLEGENSVTNANSKKNPSSYGIYVENDLTINGTGNLTSAGGNGNTTLTESYASAGIYVKGKLTIDGSGNITATGADSSGGSYGIFATKGTTISGSCNLTATGGTGTGASNSAYGIGDSGVTPITIHTSGTVKATGRKAANDSYGIYSRAGGVTIENGTVEATGDKYGIYTDSNISPIIINSGNVTATGDKYGIYTKNSTSNITINDGKVTANGKSSTNGYGLYSNGKIIINGGSGTATGGVRAMNKAPTSDTGAQCIGKYTDKTMSWPKPTTYTVIYDANDGTGEPIDETVRQLGQSFVIPRQVPVREGYIFCGWLKDGRGSNYLWPGETVNTSIQDENIIKMVAQWGEKNLSVTTGGVTTYYTTLDDAFENAPDGSTITVEKNYTDESETYFGMESPAKVLTLNLNEKNISIGDSWGGIGISGGKLTITGAGIYDGTLYQDGGELIIEDGTFGQLIVEDYYSGTLTTTLNGGIFEDSWEDGSIVYYSSVNNAEQAIKNMLGKGKKYSVDDIATFQFGQEPYVRYVAYFEGPVSVIDKPVQVTYNGNGHTGGNAPTDNSSYTSGAQVTVLGNTGSLVKTGYTFDGWNTKADGTGTTYAAGARFTITADTVLYAKWKDTTAPSGEIKVLENSWKSFINVITFGIFCNDKYDVVITAEDHETGVKSIEYLLSDTAIVETDIQTKTDWKTYSAFSIEKAGKYIIYAKITDNSDNVTYISSDGLVVDTTAPALTQNGAVVANNAKYYGDTEFTVSDLYLDTVTVDEAQVAPDANGKFTIAADNKAHTIVVTDKAGNSITRTVTVHQYFTITYKTNEGFELGTIIYGITETNALPAASEISTSFPEACEKLTNNGNVIVPNECLYSDAEFTTKAALPDAPEANGKYTVYVKLKTDTTITEISTLNGEYKNPSKNAMYYVGTSTSWSNYLTFAYEKKTEDGWEPVADSLINPYMKCVVPVKVSDSGIYRLKYVQTKATDGEGNLLFSDYTYPAAEYAEGKEVKVLPKELTITGVTAIDRDYDGTSNVVLTGGTLQGLVSDDSVAFTLGNGAMTDANAGSVKAVVTNIILTGKDAGNYVLTQPTGITVNITSASQTAPTVGKTDETIDGKADGSLTGVNNTMEYRKDGKTDYTPITGTTVEKLEDGTYYVRYKAKANYNASPEVTVTIKKGKLLNVTLPSGTGYSITADSSNTRTYNSNYTFTLTLASGYSETESFAVKANGILLTGENGIYTTTITADTEITVEGIADITAPTGEITIDTNKWHEFLNNITFGLFFKDTQSVEINAADAGSGVDTIHYYLTEAEMSLEDVKAISDWQEYSGSFDIEPNHEYIIYVKLTDDNGNVSYINSDGVVLDNILPAISGIDNGKTYHSAVEVTVSDEYFEKVTINEVTVAVEEGKFTVNPAEGVQKIVVYDKAGNTTTYQISVHLTTTVAAVAPTYEAEGNIAYWYCEECEMYFSDEACTTVITEAETIIPKLIKPTKPATETPETGDTNSLLPWMTAMLIAGTGVVLIKRKED